MFRKDSEKHGDKIECHQTFNPFLSQQTKTEILKVRNLERLLRFLKKGRNQALPRNVYTVNEQRNELKVMSIRSERTWTYCMSLS